MSALGYTTPQSSEADDGTTDTRGFLPAIVREIAPRDGIERMLVVQMATTHIALMRQGGRMAIADQLPQFEAHERACTNLARTYTAQVEALRKHRNGGTHTVTVQYIGGQALVGDINQGGGAHMKSDANPVQKAHAAPRCTATSKRSGQPCKAPTVKG